MKIKILNYSFLFILLAFSCNEPVLDSSPLNQNQSMSANLKAASIGTTYYVSPSGNNKNPGTESQPFLTADYAASKANPGDIIIFENGTYTGIPGSFVASLSRSGISSAPITYKARNKNMAILDGRYNSALGAFSISGSNINISGFEIKGMSDMGIEVRPGASNIEISDMNIHDIGRRCYTLDEGQCAFYIKSSSYITIERCLIHDIGRYGPGENGCSQPNNFYQKLDHGIYLDGSSEVTMQNNVFYNIKGGFSLQIYSGAWSASSNIYFINNTCENGNPYHKAGHVILWGSFKNSLIANNIFKDQLLYAIEIYQGSYSFSNVTITKNITSGGNGIISTGTASGVTIINNYNSTDPMFKNESIHDYSLQSNSPATITGYNTGVTTDYLNNTRTTTNIGAYGSTSSGTSTNSTPTTPPPPPTTTTSNNTTIYYNNEITGTATKNDCGAGYVGSKINYVVSANTYTSTISQADADAKAIAYVDANKQRNANDHGYCRVQ